MTRADDYRGTMTPEKARRIIAGMTTADVVLGLTAPGYGLVRWHTVTPDGPLPSAVVLDVLAERIRTAGR